MNLEDIMEPKEEFEFKPITEGLGFHKKQSPKLNRNSSVQKSNSLFSENSFSAKTQSAQSSSASTSGSSLSSTSSSLTSSKFTNSFDQKLEMNLDMDEKPTVAKSKADNKDILKQIKFQSTDSLLDLDISPTLPRKEDTSKKSNKTVLPSQVKQDSLPKEGLQTQAVDAILKSLKEKNKTDFIMQKNSVTFKPCAVDIAAAGLDSLLIVAAELFCLIIVLMLTKVDLFGLLLSPDADPMIYFAMYCLTASVTWIYLSVNRIIMGFTPGEWVFDQRLGTPEQQTTISYALKSAARSFIIVATGIIVIPIISLVMNKDLIGRWLQLELHKKA